MTTMPRQGHDISQLSLCAFLDLARVDAPPNFILALHIDGPAVTVCRDNEVIATGRFPSPDRKEPALAAIRDRITALTLAPGLPRAVWSELCLIDSALTAIGVPRIRSLSTGGSVPDHQRVQPPDLNPSSEDLTDRSRFVQAHEPPRASRVIDHGAGCPRWLQPDGPCTCPLPETVIGRTRSRDNVTVTFEDAPAQTPVHLFRGRAPGTVEYLCGPVIDGEGCTGRPRAATCVACLAAYGDAMRAAATAVVHAWDRVCDKVIGEPVAVGLDNVSDLHHAVDELRKLVPERPPVSEAPR